MLTRTRTPREFSLDLKYTAEEGVIYLTGIHALVRVPIDQRRADRRAGLRTAGFISGYPGSPLGGFDFELMRQSQLLREHEIFFTPGLNEDLAATAVWGSQLATAFPGPKYDGVLGVWFGKAPGVDRSGDALRHANFIGTSRTGGVLAYAGDDPTCKSSTLPSATELALADLGLPVLFPGNVQEVLDLGLHGYALSRCSGLWVALKIVTNVADGAGTAEVSPDRIKPELPTLEINGRPFEHRPNPRAMATPAIVEVERELFYARLELARLYARANRLNRVVLPTRPAWLGIAAAGKTFYDVRQALAELGLDDRTLERLGVRLFKINQVFPLEPWTVREFAEGLEEILVVEEKRPFIESAIREILYSMPDRPVVVGKFDEAGQPLVPGYGELDADTIAPVIAARLLRRVRIEPVEARLRQLQALKSRPVSLTVARTPYFCSGCPHNRSLEVPAGSLVGAGIGCHGMALITQRETIGQVTGITHMGGEGAQWVGIAPFISVPHFFQNLGDGTLFHSGYLAIRFAVSAGVNITYKILYNNAIAMTGGQPIPGAAGVAELTRMLEAEGVRKIIVTTDEPQKYRGARLATNAEVWHRDRLVEAQELLASIPGVTVLIHDQMCAAEKRRLRKRGRLPDPPVHVYINERVCEGCGDCGRKSNCLSVQPVETEFGTKTQIHQSSCNKDYSCLLGDCPSFITVEVKAGPRGRERRYPSFEFDLPEPELKVPTDGYSAYLMGIGGTGVVTVNQILGTAALLDGKHVRALDQTGLSQKGGPVVSHLKLFDGEPEVSSNVSAGSADLYLAFDILVGTQPASLAKADPSRTIAVVSTSRVPTGQMVTNNRLGFPELSDLIEKVEAVTRKEYNVYLDAQLVAEALFNDHMAANIVLLGAAYQAGLVPISAQAIEEAIRLNGVAVEMNLLAFRWGRLAVVDSHRVDLEILRATRRAERPAPALSPEVRDLIDSAGADGELRRLLEIRVPDLADYQDLNYARDYVEFVRRVRRVEAERVPGRTAIAEAVARYLYKLMAYKDEYEVARLHLDPAVRADLAARFGPDARVYWHLHPPLLRALGLKHKIRLGPWFGPVFRLLRAMRRLRGTPLDIFGYTRVRRLERQLIDEYRGLVERALEKLDESTYELVLAVASLPDEIRGYEGIKLAAVGRFRQRAAELMARLGTGV
jgi:indolepyruvate ferredoxin oxidoreductase